MEKETKEDKKEIQEKVNKKAKKVEKKVNTKKGKHKEKATLGDIIFRTLIMVSIFFIVLIAYTTYIKGVC